MKLLFDLFPVILFFVFFKIYDIFYATAAAIIASLIQVSVYWFKNKKFEKVHIISLATITVLGGATIILQDRLFIMWKPTIFFWAISLIFLYMQYIKKKSPLELLMGQAELQVEQHHWHRASVMAAVFFFVLGIANLLVARYYFAAEEKFFTTFGQQPEIDACENYTENANMLCLHAKEMESMWVNFKVYGVTALTFIFFISLFFYLIKNAKNLDELTSK